MKQRLVAFLVHLVISIVVALAVIGLVFFVWYPAPLHAAVGVTEIFLLLLVVDVCLGPLLTFIIYKEGKRTLKMDLAIISILQVFALVYGLYAVAEGRPAWLVFANDRFEIVRALDIDARNLDKARVEYQSPSWIKPQWVAATKPENSDETVSIIFEALAGGSDVAEHPYLYQPLAEQKKKIQHQLRRLNELTLYNSAELVAKILQTYPNAAGWLPMQAKSQDMVVLITLENIEHPTIVDLRPW